MRLTPTAAGAAYVRHTSVDLTEQSAKGLRELYSLARLTFVTGGGLQDSKLGL